MVKQFQRLTRSHLPKSRRGSASLKGPGNCKSSSRNRHCQGSVRSDNAGARRAQEQRRRRVLKHRMEGGLEAGSRDLCNFG